MKNLIRKILKEESFADFKFRNDSDWDWVDDTTLGGVEHLLNNLGGECLIIKYRLGDNITDANTGCISRVGINTYNYSTLSGGEIYQTTIDSEYIYNNLLKRENSNIEGYEIGECINYYKYLTESEDRDWGFMDDVTLNSEEILNVALEYEEYGDKYKGSIDNNDISVYEFNYQNQDYDPIFYTSVPSYLEKILNSDKSFDTKLELVLHSMIDLVSSDVKRYGHSVSHLGPKTIGRRNLTQKENLLSKLEDIHRNLGFTIYKDL